MKTVLFAIALAASAAAPQVTITGTVSALARQADGTTTVTLDNGTSAAGVSRGDARSIKRGQPVTLVCANSGGALHDCATHGEKLW